MNGNLLELVQIVVWVVVITVTIVLIFYMYRRIMFPLPKRDSIIKKKYFIRNRYIYKEFMRVYDHTKIKLFNEYLEAFNFSPLNNSYDLWLYRDEWGEIYVHLTYENNILQVKIFTKNPFTMARASSIIEELLNIEEGVLI